MTNDAWNPPVPDIPIPKGLFRVYVAAPYARAEEAREIHKKLRALQMTPTSSWAENATGKEALDTLTDQERYDICAQNDCDLCGSDVVLLRSVQGEGGEMFCELCLALEQVIPVVYVGPRFILSAYRQGVTRVDSLSSALDHLCTMRRLTNPQT